VSAFCSVAIFVPRRPPCSLIRLAIVAVFDSKPVGLPSSASSSVGSWATRPAEERGASARVP
jgi:hypothetical protein